MTKDNRELTGLAVDFDVMNYDLKCAVDFLTCLALLVEDENVMSVSQGEIPFSGALRVVQRYLSNLQDEMNSRIVGVLDCPIEGEDAEGEEVHKG